MSQRYDDPDSPDYRETNVGLGMVPERKQKAPAETVGGTPRVIIIHSPKMPGGVMKGYVAEEDYRQLERELAVAEKECGKWAEREVAELRQMVDESHGWLEDARRELSATRFLLGEARGYLEGLELADRIDAALKEPKND